MSHVSCLMGHCRDFSFIFPFLSAPCFSGKSFFVFISRQCLSLFSNVDSQGPLDNFFLTTPYTDVKCGTHLPDHLILQFLQAMKEQLQPWRGTIFITLHRSLVVDSITGIPLLHMRETRKHDGEEQRIRDHRPSIFTFLIDGAVVRKFARESGA